MPKDIVFLDILDACVRIEETAAQVYFRFSRNSSDAKLKQFWNDRAREEKTHVASLKELFDLAAVGIAANIFDTPEKIQRELEEIEKELHNLSLRSERVTDLVSYFLIAYCQEFYMLHEIIAQLFLYIENITGEPSPESTYENHLSKFVSTANELEIVTPELKLLGDTLLRQWKSNRALSLLSTIDPLTGLFNRRGFYQTALPLLHIAKRNESYVSVMMIDVDKFKRLNDTFGHQIGDEALKFVSNSIKSSIRAGDVAGRYGGEEFIIVLSNISYSMATETADRILAKICCSNTRDLPPLTASIGVSHGKITESPAIALDQFIKHADETMYAAKREGGNTILAREKFE